MNIDLKTNADTLFNPLFYKLFACKKRYVINYGGAGSSKSYSQTQYEIVRCLMKKERVLVIRKSAASLKDSVIALFTDIMTAWGISSAYTENKTLRCFEFVNGSKIMFKGIDDPEKIKSVAGLTRIWIEEANELTKEDFDQLNLRLRGSESLQITLTFNPIDETHWIKGRFFDTPTFSQASDIIKTTYLDNKFIDRYYKSVLESYKEIDLNYYNVYALGAWGSIIQGRIFDDWETIPVFPNIDGSWLALDFGYSNDPTCIIRTLNFKRRLYFDEICYRSGLTNRAIAELLRAEGYNGELVICDSAEPKSIDELIEFGINAVAADKRAGSIMTGIDFLKRNKVIVTSRSSNIIKENHFYQWIYDKRTGKYINKPKDFMNHAIDTMRYAYSLGCMREEIMNSNDLFEDINDL